MGFTAITASAAVGAGSFLGSTGNLEVLTDVAGVEYQENNAGEFSVRSSLGLVHGTSESLSSDTFQTFCLEVNESMRQGFSYNAVINTETDAGANGGPDPISSATAYLYTQFRNGTADYAYSGTVDITTSAGTETFNRHDTARAMQLAIWYLEDEISDFDEMGASDKERRLAQVYVDDATLNGAGFGLGKVRVLNVYAMNGAGRQDMLALIVPLPTTAGMALVGLGAVASRRRRRMA